MKFQSPKFLDADNNRSAQAPFPWQQLDYSNPVSSMIVPDEARYLYWLTRDYYRGLGEIVDGGPLLGGSTHALGAGLAENQQVANKGKRIHSYDLFTYFEGFKDSVLPEAGLNEGDSLLPIFLKNTQTYEAYIHVTAGDVMEARWTGQPIEILFIDLAKSWSIHNHVIKEFFGCLIPGRSIVIHQDYFHYYCYWIHLVMQYFAPYFEVIHVPEGGSLAFLATKAIPERLLDIDYATYFSREQAVQLMDEAIAPLRGPWRLLLMTAKIRLLADLQAYEQAASLAREIRASNDWEDWILYDIVQAENHIPVELTLPGLDRAQMVGMSRHYVLLQEANSVCAVPHPLGPRVQTEPHSRPEPVRADRVANLAGLIGETVHPLATPLGPALLERYQTHNLVQYEGRIYAIPISLGHVDLARVEGRSLPGLIAADSLDQARELVNRAPEKQSYVPVLLYKALYHYRRGGLKAVARQTVKFARDKLNFSK